MRKGKRERRVRKAQKEKREKWRDRENGESAKEKERRVRKGKRARREGERGLSSLERHVAEVEAFVHFNGQSENSFWSRVVGALSPLWEMNLMD